MVVTPQDEDEVAYLKRCVEDENGDYETIYFDMFQNAEMNDTWDGISEDLSSDVEDYAESLEEEFENEAEDWFGVHNFLEEKYGYECYEYSAYIDGPVEIEEVPAEHLCL